MKTNRALVCLMLMGSLVAQDLPFGESQKPQVTKPFNISYEELPYSTIEKYLSDMKGSVLVEFTINEYGQVTKPEITDTFNIKLNDAIIDKVMRIEFEPALQNGQPVKVRYKLPIMFK